MPRSHFLITHKGYSKRSHLTLLLGLICCKVELFNLHLQLIEQNLLCRWGSLSVSGTRYNIILTSITVMWGTPAPTTRMLMIYFHPALDKVLRFSLDKKCRLGHRWLQMKSLSIDYRPCQIVNRIATFTNTSVFCNESYTDEFLRDKSLHGELFGAFHRFPITSGMKC